MAAPRHNPNYGHLATARPASIQSRSRQDPPMFPVWRKGRVRAFRRRSSDVRLVKNSFRPRTAAPFSVTPLVVGGVYDFRRSGQSFGHVARGGIWNNQPVWQPVSITIARFGARDICAFPTAFTSHSNRFSTVDQQIDMRNVRSIEREINSIRLKFAPNGMQWRARFMAHCPESAGRRRACVGQAETLRPDAIQTGFPSRVRPASAYRGHARRPSRGNRQAV